MRSGKLRGRGELNPRPRLWYQARGPSLSQSNHKTQVIWKGRGGLLYYSPTEGSSFLNSQLLCSVQMLQHIMMITSIANGTLNCLLMFLTARCGLSHVGTCTPMSNQHLLANGHLRKRCLSFPSFCRRHSSHI
jgi:hypothetical protein